MDYLISVIVPAYNCEKYLEASIKSVIKQTYKNFELLIIDDGSTDNTSLLCEELKVLDNRIKVFHKGNGGLSDARNYGIKRAKGKYICFLDADDTYNKNYLSELLRLIKENNVLLAVCGYIEVFPNGTKRYSKVLETDSVLSQKEVVEKFALNKVFTAHAWTKMYDATLFEKVEFPKGKNYEDIFIMPKIIDQCDNIAFSSKHLINYNLVPNSISRSINISNEIDAFFATFEKFKLYSSIEGLYYDLAKEPIEIALRLKIHARKNKDDKYLNVIPSINKFLNNFMFDFKIYKKLNYKFKCLLLVHRLI